MKGVARPPHFLAPTQWGRGQGEGVRPRVPPLPTFAG